MSIKDPLEAAKMAAPGSVLDADVDTDSSRITELEEKNRDEIYEIAQELQISGRSKMDRDELILAVTMAESEARKPPQPEAQAPVPKPTPHTSPDASERAEEGKKTSKGIRKASERVVVASSKRRRKSLNPEWAVQNMLTVGWGGGRVLKLKPGVLISWRTHGTDCDVRLRNAGVKLMPVNDDALDVDEPGEA